MSGPYKGRHCITYLFIITSAALLNWRYRTSAAPHWSLVTSNLPQAVATHVRCSTYPSHHLWRHRSLCLFLTSTALSLFSPPFGHPTTHIPFYISFSALVGTTFITPLGRNHSFRFRLAQVALFWTTPPRRHSCKSPTPRRSSSWRRPGGGV